MYDFLWLMGALITGAFSLVILGLAAAVVYSIASAIVAHYRLNHTSRERDEPE